MVVSPLVEAATLVTLKAFPPKKDVLAAPTLLATLLVDGAATAAATLEEAHTADAMANVGDVLAQRLGFA
jgi:hypothetical protein